MRSKIGLVITICGLILAIKTSLNIWRIFKTGDRLTGAQQQLNAAKKERSELQKRLTWVQSPEFVEQEAREKLSMGRPGEVVVILPKAEQESGRVEEQEKKPNWKKWWDLYIGLP